MDLPHLKSQSEIDEVKNQIREGEYILFTTECLNFGQKVCNQTKVAQQIMPNYKNNIVLLLFRQRLWCVAVSFK
jgi:hypothetical protein